MSDFKRREPCQHPMTDGTELTDSTEVKNFRYGKLTIISGYWCRDHKSFGSWTYSAPLPRRVLAGADAPPPAPC